MRTAYKASLSAGFLFCCVLLPTRAQEAPSIAQQPASQTAVLGGNTTLSVIVSNAGPFTCQWQLNGLNLPNNIITVAGGGAGDGMPATNASLYDPLGVVVDASGNYFIADTSNHRVRKVTTNGIISTVAGTGLQGYSGDGGPAVNAALNMPYGVALDPFGNLLIADTFNNRVRQVGTNGIITTLAGTGTNGYSGDGVAATNAALAWPSSVVEDSAGNLFIADNINCRIREVATNGIITTVAGNGKAGHTGDGGAATNAELSYFPPGWPWTPPAIFSSRIRPIAASARWDQRHHLHHCGGPWATFSGDGNAATSAAVNNPSGVTVDAAGDLFIADKSNNRIRMIDTNGIITTIAGNGTNGYSGDGGAATNASLDWPYSVSLDAAGNVFIAADYNTVIRKVSTNGIISTVAGNGYISFSGDSGAATNAAINGPEAVAVDASGAIYIADFQNDRIRKVSTNGIITTAAGNGYVGFSGDDVAATNGGLNYPFAVAVDNAGNFFISDYFNNRIRKVAADGIITTVAGSGKDNSNGEGNFTGDGGPATNALLYYPSSVVPDAAGNLFLSDSENGRVREVGTNGIIMTVAGNGAFTYSGDGVAATNTALNAPLGLAVDASDNLYIADSGNNRIREVGTNGIISTVAGNATNGYSGDGGAATNAELNNPAGVALDPVGNLFIVDRLNNRIREIATDGLITTAAGNGTAAFSGDGGAATNACVNEPSGMAVDSSGDLFIADTGNNRIREVINPGPTLQFTNISAANAGTYDVVVANAYGSVTSRVAVLTVALPPLTASLNGGQGVQLQFRGAPGSIYALQTATSLAAPINWQPVFTNAADTNGNWTFTTNSVAPSARFYRLTIP